MESLVARLEAVAARLEAQAGAPAPAKGTATPSAASPGTVHPSVAAFDEILTGPLKALTTAAGTLNEPEIADATTLFADAFNAERRIIECIAACNRGRLLRLGHTECRIIARVPDTGTTFCVFSQFLSLQSLFTTRSSI